MGYIDVGGLEYFGAAMKLLLAVAAISLTLTLAACGGSYAWDGTYRGPPRGMRGDPSGTVAGIKQLQGYDANKDGMLTRAELDAQLRKDFAAADHDHNGTLDAREAQDENDRRYKESGTQYSPVLDWNQDGVIDFNEFAGGTRSLFDQLDDDHDGVLSGNEFKPPRGPQLEEERKPTPLPRSNMR